MRPACLRFLACVLVLGQLMVGLPAQALVNQQAGKPLDVLPESGGFTASAPAAAPDLFSGSATLRVPIVTPPGAGGQAPTVALAYSSAAKNGPLGMGWRLAIGSSVIQRSTRDGAPSYDLSDTFELDGERLVETGTANRFVAENYDFRRIEYDASGNFWRVLSPDGTRRYYGYEHSPGGSSPNESRLDSPEVLSSAPTSTTCPDPTVVCDVKEVIVPQGVAHSWYLDRVEDRNGNMISYRWESLGDPGARYLTEIRYNGHVGGSPTAEPAYGGSDDGTLARDRTITFGYEPRPDVMPGYRNGFRKEEAHRLADIEVRVDGALVRHYVLHYEQSPASGRSRLVQVEDRGDDDDPASAFVHDFTYGDGGPAGWSAKDATFASPVPFLSGGEDNGVRIVDVNMDGYPDILRGHSGVRQAFLGGPGGFASQSSPAWAPPDDFADGNGYTGLVLGDFNGDTRPDLLRRQLHDTGFAFASPPNPGCSAGSSAELENGPVTRGAWISDSAGWVVATEHDFAPVAFESQVFDETETFPSHPYDESCPVESIPFATRVAGIPESYDTGTRVVDVDGDGLDDIVYKRNSLLLSWQPYIDIDWQMRTTEYRMGVLLNGEMGLGSGVLNNFHLSSSEALFFGSFVDFTKDYDRSEYQFPFEMAGFSDSLSNWSSLVYCHAASDHHLVGSAASGVERIVDVNLDGLPDVLEAFRNDEEGLSELFFLPNTGYGWDLAEAGSPDDELAPPEPFLDLRNPVLAHSTPIPPDQCIAGMQGTSTDRGWRVLDVNGDGGPDLVGGLGDEVRLWDATRSSGSLWRPAAAAPWALPVGVTFGASDSQDTARRLADVNADGMVDIVESDGVYLNLAEPPDRLEQIVGPFGATTHLDYAPSTHFEDPPVDNPVVDGQMRMPRPVWALSEIRTDPGFGQPEMAQTFFYEEPVYDVEDRSFRGFGTVTVTGPSANQPELGLVQPSVTTIFHTADALAGRVARMAVHDDATGDLLRSNHYGYVHGTGSGEAGQVFDVSTINLPPSHLQRPALKDLVDLMNGAPGQGEAHVAYQVVVEERVFEGEGTSVDRRVDTISDFYGNPTLEIDHGDPSVSGDEVLTSFTWVKRDESGVYLTSLPEMVNVSGSSGPAGTAKQRKMRVYYDLNDTLGVATRGNPTRIQREWTDASGSTKWITTFRFFDAYGNVTARSQPLDLQGSSQASLTVTAWDPDTQSVPVMVNRANGEPEQLSTFLEYDLGCGPPGLGLVCRVTDPNGQVRAFEYDRFGRETLATAPGGFEQATLYHDADRGTAQQRIARRTRWDPSAGSPETDGDAIVTQAFRDGLGRAIRETRTGAGSDVAERTLAYDSAGRLAATSLWDHAGAGAITTYEYDALGRLAYVEGPDGATTQVAFAPRMREIVDSLPGEGAVRRRVERFDAFGRLAAVDEYEDPAGSPRTTTYGYDPFGNLTEVADPVANDASLCGGNAACEGQRHVTRIYYDELGNKVQLDEPDSGTWLYERDERGRLVAQTDPRGITIGFDYDTLNRIEHVAPPAPEPIQSFEWGLVGTGVPNGVGRLARIEDGEGYEEFEYDAAGNVATHRRAVGGKLFEFDHEYDPLGRRSQTDYPDGELVEWTYDKAFLVGISGTGGPFVGDYVGHVDYDALGQVTELDLGGAAVVRETRDYEPDTGLLDRVVSDALGSTVADLDYEMDGLGRVDTLAAASAPLGGGALENRSFSFQHDGLDRLVEAVGPFGADPAASATLSYAYDAVGNLTKKDDDGSGGGFATLAYEDPLRPHALTSALDDQGALQREYQYDAAGNVEKKRRPTSSNTFQSTLLEHDALGRASKTGSVTHGYDAGGRRVRVSQGSQELLLPEPGYEYLIDGGGRVNKHFFVGGRRVASAARTDWTAPSAGGLEGLLATRLPSPPPLWALAALWAFVGLLLLLVALSRRPRARSVPLRVGAAVATAVVAPALVASNCGGGPGKLGTHTEAVLFYATDHLGSTIATVDDTGTLFSRSIYKPFGDRAVFEGLRLHHGFTGEQEDKATGFYSMGPRLYDPELGRMLQPDPTVPDAGDPQAYNRYGYVLNSPLRFTDPSGFQPVCDDPRCAPLPDVGGPHPFPVEEAQIAPQLILDLSRIFDAALTIGRGIGEGLSRLRLPRARAFEGTTESAAGNAGSQTIRLAQAKNPGQGIGELPNVVREFIERGNVAAARRKNAKEITNLAIEATKHGTIRGEPIEGRDVFAFEVLTFREDPATGQTAVVGNSVVPELVPPGAPAPTSPGDMLLPAGEGYTTEIHGPTPVYCSSCQEMNREMYRRRPLR